MSGCIFCKIIADEVSTEKIAENEDIIVIKDRAPKAPIHYLIIPKKHVKDIQSFSSEDFVLATKIFSMAHELGQKLSGKKTIGGDFRLLLNSGKGAGQCVFHLHVHFLAGSDMPAF